MPKRKRGLPVHEDCKQYHALVLAPDEAGRKTQIAGLEENGLLCQHDLRRLGLSKNAWLASSYHGDGHEVYTTPTLEMALAGIAFKLNVANITDASDVLIIELGCQPGRVLRQDGRNPGFGADDLAAAGADSMLASSNVHNEQIARVWWDTSRLEVTGMFPLDDRRYGDGEGQRLLEAACKTRGYVRHRRWLGRDDWLDAFMAHLQAFEARGETALERRMQVNAAPPDQRIAGAYQRQWEINVRSRMSTIQIPASLLSRARTSGLLWTRKKIEKEQERALLELMTPTNLRRWGSFRTAFAEMIRAGFHRPLVSKVLKGRFGSQSSVASAYMTKRKRKTLVPIPVELTCHDVDEMDKGAARKAYTAYVGPLRQGDKIKGSVALLREALKRAIISHA